MKIRPVDVLRTYPDTDLRQRYLALARARADCLREGRDHRAVQAEMEKIQGECAHRNLVALQRASKDLPLQGIKAGEPFYTCWECAKFLGKSPY